jgi:tetratricopeptide (TPR) repeat protein
MGAPTTTPLQSSTVERSPLQAARRNNMNHPHNYNNNDTTTTPAPAAMGTTTTTNNNTSSSINTDKPVKATVKNMEATYTSLIQQYLQVMCLDNATFLAERMVATCSKTTNALYLLALCHYRSNRPQRAQSVLDECKRHNAATRYLLAKCCFDLEQYGRAEEALLQQARSDYREYKTSIAAERAWSGGGDVASSLLSMDEWILDTTPCPVPNGAAGLHLLANICRRSNRKQRAMQYYRLALKVSLALCDDCCRRSILKAVLVRPSAHETGTSFYSHASKKLSHCSSIL